MNDFDPRQLLDQTEGDIRQPNVAAVITEIRSDGGISFDYDQEEQ